MTRPGSGRGPDDRRLAGPPPGRSAGPEDTWDRILRLHAETDGQARAGRRGRHAWTGSQPDGEPAAGPSANGHADPRSDHVGPVRRNGLVGPADRPEPPPWAPTGPAERTVSRHAAQADEPAAHPWEPAEPVQWAEPRWDELPVAPWEASWHPAQPDAGGPRADESPVQPWQADGHISEPNPEPPGRAWPEQWAATDEPPAPPLHANGHAPEPDPEPPARSPGAGHPGSGRWPNGVVGPADRPSANGYGVQPHGRWGDVPVAGSPFRSLAPTPAPTPTAEPVERPRPTPRPLDDSPTQLLRRYIPAGEVLGREEREPAADRPPPGTSHPRRAVVRRRRTRRRRLEWPFLILFALLSAFLIRTYAVQTFYIPSGSMHETLLEGDRVLVNKVGYHLHEVNRGDVVVFRRPAAFQVEDADLIKRVIGLPGETLEARGRQIYVDGRPLTEPYVEPVCGGTDDFGPIAVPAGSLWVMGDNRCDSSDSRVFGPIERELVVGRAFVLAWPFPRLSWL